jgi:serine/threonine protein kinase
MIKAAMNKEPLFHEALAKPAAEWAAILDAACARQPELRAAVEALLAAQQASGLLDRPAAELAQTIDSKPGQPPHEATSEYTPQTDEAARRAFTTLDYRAHSETGAVIAGRYTLVEKLGEGGMGEVWVAKQTEPVKRKVALKLIKAGMDSKAVLQRFEQERQALALMDHPNIARVLDGGLTPTGQPFFVMELVNGLPLTRFCDKGGLTPQARLELFVPICHAVQHAHQKGIVHRDLKPANILVTLIDGKPVPRVIDFGVAKATSGKLTDESLSTHLGAVVGTLEYMSPEQAGYGGEDVDTRADIYSLGVILYELLTGLRPIDAKRLKKAALSEMIRIIQEEEPSKPSTRLSTDDSLPSLAAVRQTEPKKLMALLRGELDWVVMKCLEKQRDRRYETANALARDIQRYLADEPVEARPPSFGYRAGKLLRRNKGPVIAASLVFVALIAGMAGTTWGLVEARRQEAEAKKHEGFARKEAEAKEKARAAATQKAEAERRERQRAEFAEAEALANEQKAQRRLSQIEKANEILGSIFTNLDPNEIAKNKVPLQAVLVKNLDTAVAQLEGEAIGDPLVVASMQNTFGLSLSGLGEYEKAAVLYKRAWETAHEQLGPDEFLTLAYMGNLAAAYRDGNKWDQAIPLLEQTLERKAARLGPADPDTLITMNNLATAYFDAGMWDRARPLFEELLKLRRERLGNEDPNTLLSMDNLAATYTAMGQRNLALPLIEEAVRGRNARLGPEHPDTLRSLNNLAASYGAAEQWDRAAAIMEETAGLSKANLGPEHPETLTTMHNLATVYKRVGKLDKALPLLKATLQVRKDRLGPDDPETMITMGTLAQAYQESGNLGLAVPLYEETLGLMKARLGADHPHTVITMGSLAGAYWQRKQLDKSVPLFEECYQWQLARFGRDDPGTYQVRYFLGINYSDAGRFKEAIPLLEESLQATKNNPALVADGPKTGMALLDAYAKSGEKDKFHALLSEQLTEARSVIPKGTPMLAGTLAHFGLALLEQQEWNQAESLLRECLAIREATEPDSWTTFNTKSLLGGALLGQNNYDEAEPLLLAGYEGMKQRETSIPEQGKVRILEAIVRLVQLYEATDKKDAAANWQRELEAMNAAQKVHAKQP